MLSEKLTLLGLEKRILEYSRSLSFSTREVGGAMAAPPIPMSKMEHNTLGGHHNRPFYLLYLCC